MAEKKISRSSWRGWLNQTKASLEARVGRPPRIAILGVGNELNGDDGAGLLAVRVLKQTGLPSDHFLLLETGPAPENFTGPVTRFAPDWVLAIDAARLEAAAGHIQPIALNEIEGVSAATHGLPLSIVGRYLIAQTGCEFSILGIQVAQTEFGQALSPAVRRSALRMGKFLAEFMQA